MVNLYRLQAVYLYIGIKYIKNVSLERPPKTVHPLLISTLNVKQILRNLGTGDFLQPKNVQKMYKIAHKLECN